MLKRKIIETCYCKSKKIKLIKKRVSYILNDISLILLYGLI